MHNYLPYTKMVYNAEELSLNAERIRRFRNRQNTVKKIEEHFATGSGTLPALVWSALEEFQEYPFRTADGQKFSFAIKGTKIVINQEKVLSKASINRALQQVIEMERKVMQPEDLQLPEAGFLYPVFKRIKIIE